VYPYLKNKIYKKKLSFFILFLKQSSKSNKTVPLKHGGQFALPICSYILPIPRQTVLIFPVFFSSLKTTEKNGRENEKNRQILKTPP
jgi:hypothetical protein